MNNLFEDFPDRLDFVLIKLGWGKDTFYKESGIPVQLIESWLNGRVKPSVSDIYRVCRITGASSDYFYGLTDAPDIATPNRYVSVLGLDDDQIAEVKKQISDYQRKNLLRKYRFTETKKEPPNGSS